jgi:hypothetical protein
MLLGSLHALEDQREEEKPLAITLAPAVKERWIQFYDEANAQLHREHDGPARSARAKAINHAARLVLIFHLCRTAGTDEVGTVEMPGIERGVTAAR